MIEVALALIFSGVAFGGGCFMAYQVVWHRERWNAFWERQNRQRFLAPIGWAESAVSRWFSYLFVVILLAGGLTALVASFLNLLALAT